MKFKLGVSAFSEIIGAAILLAMAVVIFSVIYINVLSDDGPHTNAFVTISGKMETWDKVTNIVAFENQRGIILGSDTKIILTKAGLYGETINTTMGTYYLVKN